MPRQSRLDIPGLLQHVIVRGIERRKIFRNNTDRQDFVQRFSTLLEQTGTDCFAWALIPNHFHLLLRPNHCELKQFMCRLLTGYAICFNKRHGRSGHLFQNRCFLWHKTSRRSLSPDSSTGSAKGFAAHRATRLSPTLLQKRFAVPVSDCASPWTP